MLMTPIHPPKNFRVIEGLKEVRLCDRPGFAHTKRPPRGAKAKGLRYERKVAAYLDKSLPSGEVGIAGLWLEYTDKNGPGYAQPDYLTVGVGDGRIILVEVKLARVPRAWWQLNKLYRPLIEKVFPGFEICPVEVAATARETIVPEPVGVIHNIMDARPDRTSFLRLPYDCA